jgi:hypothetical protein
MKMSKNNKIMVYAFKKGYCVDESGNVFYKNKKRALNIATNKYYSFSIKFYDEEKRKNIVRPIWVHRLQAYHKFGNKIFKDGIEVRHLDSNCLNNKYDNIVIGTHSKNMMDISENMRLSKAIFATSFVKIHNHAEVIKLHKQGLSYNEIIKITGIKGKGMISFIVNNSIESKK